MSENLAPLTQQNTTTNGDLVGFFKRKEIIQYIIIVGILTAIVFIFSVFMIAISGNRNTVSSDNYISTSQVYNTGLKQSSPLLSQIELNSDYNRVENKILYTEQQLAQMAGNIKIVSTDSKVLINAEFVKKGLEYQPTFNTAFEAVYRLQNEADKESLLVFEFPFPYQLSQGELSDVVLKVDGEAYTNAKANLVNNNYTQTQGLRWEGQIPANSTREIFVSYRTVGLATFSYEGIENAKSAQDFNMHLTINGTRSYDVTSGLSVDKREFTDNSVVLTWNKPSLFSAPQVKVSVGEKTSPSNKVSRVYVAMVPIFLGFVLILIWFGLKSSKLLKIRDLVAISFLFLIYFPLLHYLTSFTIDPTMEFYEGFAEVGFFSMPLYVAFALALTIIGGLMFYLHSRIYGLGFSLKSALPTILIMLGFFPFVITIPEYSILLVLFGIIALAFIWIQTRVKEKTV